MPLPGCPSVRPPADPLIPLCWIRSLPCNASGLSCKCDGMGMVASENNTANSVQDLAHDGECR